MTDPYGFILPKNESNQFGCDQLRMAVYGDDELFFHVFL